MPEKELTMYKKGRKSNYNRPTPNTPIVADPNAPKQFKQIIIAERDKIAAVVYDKKVSDFFINRGEILLGDVYLSKVDNILPSIDAAFVDVGVEKMGFLHAQDVMGKGTLREKLTPNQKLVVQVTKEPIGHKGPRVTTELSIPGRFLVLIPNDTGVNVSKKITAIKERARLKSLVSLMKPVGVGVIIRTEAQGQSDEEIKEDMETLLERWQNIVTASDTVDAPNLLHRDQDLLYKVIREACGDDTDEIIVDTTFAFNRVQGLLQTWKMNKDIKVIQYKGEEPILNAYDIHKEIKSALQTKVNLPSGGYLYIQTTEALSVIDVNSGKFVSSATQDETIYRTNKEAVCEIARQLRLRNLGGMIIIDFIDMNLRGDKLAILEELEIALEPDKAKPQIGQLSDLGLVELTRHRQGQSLSEIFTKKCPHCQGTGYMMEDMKFIAPSQDAEFVAKSTKGKNRNNKNKNKKPFKNDAQEVTPIVEETVAVVEVTEVKEVVEATVETKLTKKATPRKSVKEVIEDAIDKVTKKSKAPKKEAVKKETTDKVEKPSAKKVEKKADKSEQVDKQAKKEAPKRGRKPKKIEEEVKETVNV